MNITYFKCFSSIVGALILISCSGESSFTGSNSQAREDQESPYQEENLEPATEVSSSAGNSCTPNQIQTQIPVSLNFVVDISTTMEDEISILKNRMGAFVSAVSNAGIESISYSLTLFVDNVTYRSGLVSAQRILSDIPQIELGGQLDNKDMPEAAFEGLMRSQQLALQAPAKNIYIVITDDTMHYGGGPNKDASLRKCEVNTIANSIADNSMVLFWANESRPHPINCGRYRTGKEQVEDLVRLKSNVRYMGSQFRADNLTNEILSLIKVSVNQGC